MNVGGEGKWLRRDGSQLPPLPLLSTTVFPDPLKAPCSSTTVNHGASSRNYPYHVFSLSPMHRAVDTLAAACLSRLTKQAPPSVLEQ